MEKKKQNCKCTPADYDTLARIQDAKSPHLRVVAVHRCVAVSMQLLCQRSIYVLVPGTCDAAFINDYNTCG